MILFLITISKSELILFRNGTNVLNCEAPYLSPRGYPATIPQKIFGQLYYYRNFNSTINQTELAGKIVLSDWYGPADRNIIQLAKMGVIGVIFESTNKIGGFRVSQFDNLESFNIVAVDIYTDHFNYLVDLLNNGEILNVSLKADTNQWKDFFHSGSFIFYKIFWILFHLTAISICAYTLILIKKEKIKIQSITVKHNLILMIITNAFYIFSLIDVQGQDQLYPSQIATSLRSLGNIFMLADVLLYIVVMYTIISSKKNLEVNIFVRNIKFYYIIGTVFISIALICQLAVLFGDRTKKFSSLMTIVIFGFDLCFMLGCGIFYVVGASMVTRKISKSESSKVQMKKNIIYIWITGTSILIRGFWQITILYFLRDPSTYTLYLWIDNILYGGVICGLTLQWLVNYKLKLSSKSSTKTSLPTTNVLTTVNTATPRSDRKSDVSSKIEIQLSEPLPKIDIESEVLSDINSDNIVSGSEQV